MPKHKEPDDTGQSRDSDKGTVGQRFTKKLTKSGSGEGVSLHIDALLAREYDLDPNTEVEVTVVEESGDVAFRIDIPAGFTHEELESFASNEGWTLVDKYVDEEGPWSLTYQTQNREARISIDSESRIDGHHVNNVTIESASMEVSDYKDYQEVATTALRKELQVRLRDSDGLWQRLRGSADHETDDAPDEDTVKQLLENTDWVSVQLVDQQTSTKTTLDKIGAVTNGICTAVRELEDKISGSVYKMEFAEDPTGDDAGKQAKLGEVQPEDVEN